MSSLLLGRHQAPVGHQRSVYQIERSGCHQPYNWLQRGQRGTIGQRDNRKKLSQPRRVSPAAGVVVKAHASATEVCRVAKLLHCTALREDVCYASGGKGTNYTKKSIYRVKLTMSAWQRKPCENWPAERCEDLFQCWRCTQWRPWFHFTKASDRVRICCYSDFEAILQDDGGWVHACNDCFQACCHKLMRPNAER